MYAETLLVTVVRYEIGKRRSLYALKAAWHALDAATLAFAEEWDKFYPEAEAPCDATIMCQRQGKRHKRHCPLNRNYSDNCPEGKQFTCSTVHRSAN